MNERDVCAIWAGQRGHGGRDGRMATAEETELDKNDTLGII